MLNVMFRTETFSGSGVRRLADIIEHEMSELRNKDIPQYVLNHYKDRLSGALRTDFEIILGEDPNGLYPYIGDGCGRGASGRNDLRRLISGMIAAVGGNTHLNYGLWLASRKEVIDHYTVTPGDCIDAYPVSPFIFSDLGADGILFGYELRPMNLPDALRYELVRSPESQPLIDDAYAIAISEEGFASARFFPQDYIERTPDENVFNEDALYEKAYYCIRWPYSQKAEARFHELGANPGEFLHDSDSQDVFVSATLLNKLVCENESYKVRIPVCEDFLHPRHIYHQVEVYRTRVTPAPGHWTHFFESGGRCGYASSYDGNITIREIKDGTTYDRFSGLPEDHEYRKIYFACEALGLPCSNITFYF